MNKTVGKSKKVIISVAVGSALIIAGVFVAKSMFFNEPKKPVNAIEISQTTVTDNKTTAEPTIVLTATSEIKETTDKVFNLKTAKVGEKYGEMVVSKVDKNIDVEEDATTVIFGGEIGISGTYRSEYAGMYGEYITLILDEESRRKVPAESITIDPIGPKNEKALDLFGKTGTTGSFSLIISGFTHTNQIESYGCTADLEKVIEIKKDEIQVME